MFSPSLLGDLLWVSYSRLALGQVGQLRLAPDGVSPGPPDGVACNFGGPLPDYYATAFSVLADQLRPAGYQTIQVGFDWRKEIVDQGRSLAGRILAQVDPGDPCAIVAHSHGGLVARAAWSLLVGSGESARVRRIVTLGAPHRGSYAAPGISCLARSEAYQVAALSQVSLAINLGGVPPTLIDPPRWTVADVAALAASWPALYELYPALPPTPEDPQRAALYDARLWPVARGVQQRWLDYAATTYAAWRDSSASIPPASVLTTVGGTGWPTTDGLVVPSALGSPAALGSTDQGDGTVTLASALVPGSRTYTVQLRHADLPRVLALSGDLAVWVQETVPSHPSQPWRQGFFQAGPPVPSSCFLSPAG
jgi:hypothetical protein